MEGKFELIELDRIKIGKYNVRTHDMGDESKIDFAKNIKAMGLINPILVYKEDESLYMLLAGQRRYNAYRYLNETQPDGKYGKILCRIIPEPENEEIKKALSLAENTM